MKDKDTLLLSTLLVIGLILAFITWREFGAVYTIALSVLSYCLASLFSDIYDMNNIRKKFNNGDVVDHYGHYLVYSFYKGIVRSISESDIKNIKEITHWSFFLNSAGFVNFIFCLIGFIFLLYELFFTSDSSFYTSINSPYVFLIISVIFPLTLGIYLSKITLPIFYSNLIYSKATDKKLYNKVNDFFINVITKPSDGRIEIFEKYLISTSCITSIFFMIAQNLNSSLFIKVIGYINFHLLLIVWIYLFIEFIFYENLKVLYTTERKEPHRYATLDESSSNTLICYLLINFVVNDLSEVKLHYLSIIAFFFIGGLLISSISSSFSEKS